MPREAFLKVQVVKDTVSFVEVEIDGRSYVFPHHALASDKVCPKCGSKVPV